MDHPQAQTVAEFKARIEHYLTQTALPDKAAISAKAYLKATCMAINDVIHHRLHETVQRHQTAQSRSINYLSLEYLMGRMLSNNLHNLDCFAVAAEALQALGVELTDLFEEGHDLALGNGGLGRLAACYLDSMATLELDAMGYGIHYQHGLFEQQFHHGRQIETPDEWREYGSPWEVCRPEAEQEVFLYGHVEIDTGEQGKVTKTWHPGQIIRGVPWDVPVVGYRGKTVNTLRLWESRASSHFDWVAFNEGNYQSAHIAKNQAETISKVLYPNDDTAAGKELRFIQQYFFCACSINDILARFQERFGDDWSQFPSQVVIQLNDTHPTLAIVELMRVFIDQHQWAWHDAWEMCQQVFAYTNHTLLPEALETWSVDLFQRVLPRHLEIVYEINEWFLNQVVNQQWPGDVAKRRALSLIAETPEKSVRMAHLCVVTAYRVNGVAAIHSELVKSDLFPEFHQLWPSKLVNVTNGITPRRWLKVCNPKLSELLDQHIVGDWALDLTQLAQLKSLADDASFQQKFMAVKRHNKQCLAQTIWQQCQIRVDPDALFDVQIKRLHEYKRQHLNLLHIMALYWRILNEPDFTMHPRVFIFGAKAAPGYYLAKEIIYAINCVAETINNDARVKGLIKVVFLPNYRVSLAEKIIPAADLSEQISTAGKEASGTGNMKLALNGALTIGTMDGANIEIAEEVGRENIFIFGLNVEQIKQLNNEHYEPWHYYHQDSLLRHVLDSFLSDQFTPGRPGELSAIRDSLLEAGDPYRVLADFQSYCVEQQRVNDTFCNSARWAKMAILNTASMGKFNSDRSINDYQRLIWSQIPQKKTLQQWSQAS
ncbi:MAG: glycogen/starch/alpha-glucan phosphorylase [Gammaproteobacteria bacterium]|nr:glycogen/starch/alpha-glucan phosphorylase [Gammaproteobacteria bacterium]